MKQLAIVFIIACAWIIGRAAPKMAEGVYQLERQREAQEFILQAKGIQTVKPRLRTL